MEEYNMYEYIEGKSMYAKVSTPNTMFEPHKYQITVLTDIDTATRLEGLGLSQVKTKDGQLKYEEPAFSFSRRATRPDGTANQAPRLIDSDGSPLDVSVGNGSEVRVKIKPYTGGFGTFAELMAVKVLNLVEYADADSDNEEF
jgi:hypothetical protein|tara:strand:+ start:5441 stop:5869 length:429 start_codon:yes stop_codon:yes gene_type:complete